MVALDCLFCKDFCDRFRKSEKTRQTQSGDDPAAIALCAQKAKQSSRFLFYMTFSSCLIGGRPVKATTNPRMATIAPRMRSLSVRLVIPRYPKAKGEAASQIPTKTWKIIKYRRLPIAIHPLSILESAVLSLILLTCYKEISPSRPHQPSLTFLHIRHSSQTSNVLSIFLYLTWIHSWIPTQHNKGL